MLMSTIYRAPERAADGFDVPSIDQIISPQTDRFPRLAVLGSIGLLLVGGYAALEPSGPPGLKAQPAEAHSQKRDKQDDQKSDQHHRRDCTTFRIAPKDIYAGSGCGQEGATAEIVGDGHLEKGWSYSAIVTSGVKKCFFVRQGVLPRPARSDPKLISLCQSYYPKLVESKRTYLTKYNCDFLPPRTNDPSEVPLQGCRSGTRHTPIVSTCLKNVVFRNYATAEPSPWNADGTATAGFSDKVKDSQGRKAVSYRVKIKDRPRNGHKAGAAVIRGTKKEHGWGLMYPDCPDPHMLRGGVSTLTKQG